MGGATPLTLLPFKQALVALVVGNLILFTIFSFTSYMVAKLKENIDRIKTRPDPETVILVGGGSAMWQKKLGGAKEVIRPEAAQYANAVGAATALIGAIVEKAFSYDSTKREQAISITRAEAEKKAVEAGVDPSTLQVTEVEEVAMPYLPGNALKIRVKVIGKLKLR